MFHSRLQELHKGDALEVILPGHAPVLGILRFTGRVEGYSSGSLSDAHLGIELLKPMRRGNNGTVFGRRYFEVDEGHGLFVAIHQVIRKLSVNDLMVKLKLIFQMHQREITKRDAIIEELSSEFSESKSQHSSDASVSASEYIAADGDFSSPESSLGTCSKLFSNDSHSDEYHSPIEKKTCSDDELDDDFYVANDTGSDESSSYPYSDSHSPFFTPTQPQTTVLHSASSTFEFPDTAIAAVELSDCPSISVAESIEKEKMQKRQMEAAKRDSAVDSGIGMAATKRKRAKIVTEMFTPMDLASTRAQCKRLLRAQKNSACLYDSDSTDTSLSTDESSYDSSEEDVLSMRLVLPPSQPLSPSPIPVPSPPKRCTPKPRTPFPTAKKSSVVPKKAAVKWLGKTGCAKKKQGTFISMKLGQRRCALTDSRRSRLPKYALPDTPIEARKKKARFAAEQRKRYQLKAVIETAADSGTMKGHLVAAPQLERGSKDCTKMDAVLMSTESELDADIHSAHELQQSAQLRSAKRRGGVVRPDAHTYELGSKKKATKSKPVCRKQVTAVDSAAISRPSPLRRPTRTRKSMSARLSASGRMSAKLKRGSKKAAAKKKTESETTDELTTPPSTAFKKKPAKGYKGRGSVGGKRGPVAAGRCFTRKTSVGCDKGHGCDPSDGAPMTSAKVYSYKMRTAPMISSCCHQKKNESETTWTQTFPVLPPF